MMREFNTGKDLNWFTIQPAPLLLNGDSGILNYAISKIFNHDDNFKKFFNGNPKDFVDVSSFDLNYRDDDVQTYTILIANHNQYRSVSYGQYEFHFELPYIHNLLAETVFGQPLYIQNESDVEQAFMHLETLLTDAGLNKYVVMKRPTPIVEDMTDEECQQAGIESGKGTKSIYQYRGGGVIPFVIKSSGHPYTNLNEQDNAWYLFPVKTNYEGFDFITWTIKE